MAITSVTSQATATLKNITAAANKLPAKPITMSASVFMKLTEKLTKLAGKDAPKVSGLVDLMEELHTKGKLNLTGNTGPLSYSSANMWRQGMNSIKDVLNNNAVTSDDKPTSPIMK